MGAVRRQSRQWLRQRYSHLYLAIGRTGDPCTYCGLPADTVDHVPPLKALGVYGSEYFYGMGVQPSTLPSCTECNVELSCRSLWWVDDRCAFLVERYKRKYFDLLDRPSWSQDEINELDGMLRGYVEDSAMLRMLTVRRLDRLREGTGRSESKAGKAKVARISSANLFSSGATVSKPVAPAPQSEVS